MWAEVHSCVWRQQAPWWSRRWHYEAKCVAPDRGTVWCIRGRRWSRHAAQAYRAAADRQLSQAGDAR